DRVPGLYSPHTRSGLVNPLRTAIGGQLAECTAKVLWERNMGHVVRETGWCVIDIDTTHGTIFLQERWLYTWLVQPPLLPWTLTERRNFHNNADRGIWATWSNRAKLRAAGASDFARRFTGRDITINLDIRWVTARPHWNVTVTKIPRNQFATSSVLWNARRITLDSNDTHVRTFVNGPGTPNTT